MSKNELDIEKLLAFQEKQNKKYSEIKSQIEFQLEEYGEFLLEMTKIKPNVESFTNWFFDNYYHIINKKRKGNFVLDKKYAIEYCNLLKEELLESYDAEKFNLSNSTAIETKKYEHYDTIIKYLIELFEKDKTIEESIIIQIAEEVSYILKNEESLQQNFEIIKRREISTKQESIRYCFYQFYEVKKTKHIRKLLIEYLLKKFEVFQETSYTTINSHFKEKPDYYPM